MRIHYNKQMVQLSKECKAVFVKIGVYTDQIRIHYN